MKKTLVAGLALMAAPIALTACGSDTAEETQAPEGVGFEIENARLVLPAVEGNPSATYFDVKNTNDRNIAIGSVSVEKATTTSLHGYYIYEDEPAKPPRMIELGPQVVDANATLKFEPGDKHVMVMDLDPGVKAGDTLEVTISVAGGDKQSFPAKVVAAGEGVIEE